MCLCVSCILRETGAQSGENIPEWPVHPTLGHSLTIMNKIERVRMQQRIARCIAHSALAIICYSRDLRQTTADRNSWALQYFRFYTLLWQNTSSFITKVDAFARVWPGSCLCASRKMAQMIIPFWETQREGRNKGRERERE